MSATDSNCGEEVVGACRSNGGTGHRAPVGERRQRTFKMKSHSAKFPMSTVHLKPAEGLARIAGSPMTAAALRPYGLGAAMDGSDRCSPVTGCRASLPAMSPQHSVTSWQTGMPEPYQVFACPTPAQKHDQMHAPK